MRKKARTISLRLNAEAELALRVLLHDSPGTSLTDLVEGLIIDRGGDVRSRWARDAKAASGMWEPGRRRLVNEAQLLLHRATV